MTHFIVTDKDHHYWTGSMFHHSFLRAFPVEQAEAETVARWFPDRGITAQPIKWTEHVATFARTLREEGDEGVYYYLFLKAPGYPSQSFAMSRWTDCNGRRSVRCRYGASLHNIKVTARVCDEVEALVARAMAARKRKAA